MKNYNETFLNVIKESLITFLKTNSRSNKKLKILHGEIKNDLKNKFNQKQIKNVELVSIDKNKTKEDTALGRYYGKKVDISIRNKDELLGALSIKFIMNNYKQNANNYFETMLGETANLRSAGIPYFQIVILFDKMPYFKKGGEFKSWETLDKNHLKKYIQLSKDKISDFFHTPNLTYLGIISLDEKILNSTIKDKNDYRQKILNYINDGKFKLNFSNRFDKTLFKKSVIYNDYNEFLDRVVYYFLFNGLK